MIISDTVSRDTVKDNNSGLVYVFTGEGKGKTSAALGVATRSLLIEKKVVWIAFYKQESGWPRQS
ncbi:MAG: hypothetical protein E6R05_01140 [Candidatus Moraniibacteriota bacterium]|nr:MAG: hypothetical protein E6R05_01140 [Candidatus Moranbacteria bacterium]